MNTEMKNNPAMKAVKSFFIFSLKYTGISHKIGR